MRLIARKREINLIGKILSSPKPEFVALFGRRRVGKTFLINEFFKQNNKSTFCLLNLPLPSPLLSFVNSKPYLVLPIKPLLPSTSFSFRR